MNRNSRAFAAAALAVIAMIVAGFWIIGSPAHERRIHQDLRTVQALHCLASDIYTSYSSKHTLAADLGQFRCDDTQDPTTHKTFIYHVKSGSTYELCATFLTNNTSDYPNNTPFWRHPEGAQCFQLDASVDVPIAPIDNSF